jgi:hypothetical protein
MKRYLWPEGADAMGVMLEYVLEQWCQASWPAYSVLALCQVAWPDRTFAIDGDGEDENGMYTLAAAYDVATGEDAWDLYHADRERGRFPPVVYRHGVPWVDSRCLEVDADAAKGRGTMAAAQENPAR